MNNFKPTQLPSPKGSFAYGLFFTPSPIGRGTSWTTKGQRKIWVRVFCLLFAICFLIFTGFGCAKTVTPIVDYGEQMVVNITLRGNVDLNNYRYFLVLSGDSSYNFAVPPSEYVDDDAPEFIEPGDTPLQGSVEAYYNTYFSTWSGYIVLDQTMEYTAVQGPFVINQTATREVFSTFPGVASTLSYTMALRRIFPVTIPDTIYFDFVIVSWPNGGLKLATDHLPSTDNSISKISGSQILITDPTDLDLVSGSSDILRVEVSIE